MQRFNVGDLVFVPNAFEWVWEAYTTQIKEVMKEDNKIWYYADCTRNNLASQSSGYETIKCKFSEKEVFPHTQDGLNACKEYINNYYYSGKCKGCEYDNKSGTVYRCAMCSHCKDMGQKSPTESRPLKCELNNIVVGEFYNKGKSHEICRNFDPVLPQHVKEFVSWEHYDDILKNCEFNRECPLHKESCHKTCSYEYWMDEKLVNIPMNFLYKGREVKNVKVSRRRWVNQDFLVDGKLKCFTLEFKYELNKRGLPRKEDKPIRECFGKETIIEI